MNRVLSLATQAAPFLIALLLAAPVLAGLAGTVLPAFGYFPALGGDTFGLEAFRSLFSEPGIGASVWLALFTGLSATAISLGIVMLFIGAAGGTNSFRWMARMISPLLAVPHAAAAFGFLFLLSPSGFLARLLSPELTGWTRPPDVLIPNDPMGLSLIAGLALKEMPFLLLMALGAMGQMPIAESRRVVAGFGYGRLAGFLIAIWPGLYRRLRLPVLAVLAFSISVVDVAAILGPTNPATLAMRITGWMNEPDLSRRFIASAGSLVLILVTLCAIGIWLMLERAGRAYCQWQGVRGRRFARDGALRGAAIAIAGLGAASVLLGLGLLALWSVSGLWQFPDALPAELSLSSWRTALGQAGGLFATTISLAMASSAIAATLVVLALQGERPGAMLASAAGQWIIYLPLLAPQAAFLFGLQMLVLRLGCNVSLALLIFAHLIFVMPYVYLSLRGPWHGFDARFENIARGLGHSPLQVFLKVRLPLMLRPILTAFAVGFAVSIGLYLPTVLIGAGRLPTITTEAVALASGGNRRLIGIYAFLQALLPFAVFMLAALVPNLLFTNRRAMRQG